MHSMERKKDSHARSASLGTASFVFVLLYVVCLEVWMYARTPTPTQVFASWISKGNWKELARKTTERHVVLVVVLGAHAHRVSGCRKREERETHQESVHTHKVDEECAVLVVERDPGELDSKDQVGMVAMVELVLLNVVYM